MKGILVELRDMETGKRIDFTTLSCDAPLSSRLDHAHRMKHKNEVCGVYVVEKEVDYDTKEIVVLNNYELVD